MLSKYDQLEIVAEPPETRSNYWLVTLRLTDIDLTSVRQLSGRPAFFFSFLLVYFCDLSGLF